MKRYYSQFKWTLLFSFFGIFASCYGQEVSADLEVLETKIDSVFNTTMEAEHIPGAAFILVKDGKTILKKGYGYTSLGEEIRRVSPDSTIFRIGSITKTFTATALLQLVDQKKLDLNTDVNTYLKTIQVPSTFVKPVTPAHLLNHSAGFDELRGRVVYNQNELIPLNTFLENRLIRIRESGVVSSYSSFGIALAGLLVEETSQLSLEDYFKENIWAPLGMNMTSMGLNDQVENYASWGYEYRNGINVPMPWEYYHTYPASDINSTVADMGKYIQMHLDDGKFNNTTILSSKMAKAMKEQQMPIHPELESFCYGFYEEFAQGIRTVSHGGDMLGYSGYMALVPDLNLGVYVVHHHEGTRMRYQVLNTILSHFSTSDSQAVVPSKIPGDLSKFAGRYKWSTYCHSCTDSWQPEEEELIINDDNSVTIMNQKYYQVAPLLFKSENGLRTMGFLEDENGKIIYMSLGSSNMFERVD